MEKKNETAALPTEEEALKGIIEDELKIPAEKVVPAARLVEDLGSNRRHLNNIVLEVQLELEVDLNDVDFKSFVTVQDLLDFVASPESYANEHPQPEPLGYPADLKYSKGHEWVKVDGKNASIGITEYAEKAVGNIVHVSLPKVGTEIVANQDFEAVKADVELFAPVSGTVTEVNGVLNGEDVNDDPYGSWMIKVALNDPNELKSLLSVAEYKKFVEEDRKKMFRP